MAAGGSTAGQPSAGTGGSTVVLETCGNGTCDQHDAALGCAWECSCGDGLCTSGDFDFTLPGPNYLSDLDACRADCHSCGNNQFDVQDQWLGCPGEKPEVKPTVICPFPVWSAPLKEGFVNPYTPNGFKIWQYGNRVKYEPNGKCYRLDELDSNYAPVDKNAKWTEIPCDC